jgi:hypothetical protein
MTGNGRDDRVPRIRVLENHEHMVTCTVCQSKYDTRLFIGCPLCTINNARKRRASDSVPDATGNDFPPSAA